MPVTVYPAAHPARALQSYHTPVRSSDDLLKEACADEWRRCRGVIQSSFDGSPLDTLYPEPNGFVRTCILAYSEHHHLYIRPDDVWFAILNQLSFYINAHAEELRKFFVSHEGLKPLTVFDSGTLGSTDFGSLAVRMTQEIEKNVNDPELQTWIMPDFSTTTDSDHVIAAVLFMGAMQEYFTFKFELDCGIPSVTVLGEKADWEKIRSRLDKIDQLGEEPAQFAALLRTVLDFFIKTFDNAECPDVIDFWGRIAHEYNNGSGPTWLSGWITAFCFWDNKGKRLSGPSRSSLLAEAAYLSSMDEFSHLPEELVTLADLESQSTPPDSETPEPNVKDKTKEDGIASSSRLDLDQFHTVDTEDIPNGYSSVPVTVDDHGTKYLTRMVAGSVGMQAWSSGQPIDTSIHYNGSGSNSTESDGTGIDSIQSVSGWWMYKLSAAAGDEREEIKDIKRGLKPVKSRSTLQQKKKKDRFKKHQKKMVRRSKLREILNEEKAKVELESTGKKIAAN